MSDILDNNNNLAPNIVTAKSVKYYGEVSGFLVFPPNNNAANTDKQKKYPAVIMIHEWWGLNDDIRNNAKELAKEGYVILAVDLYNGKITTHTNLARKLSAAVKNNPKPAIENLKSAVLYLSSINTVNSSKIVSLGWSFGGAQSLQLALNSQKHPLCATIIYYGNLITDTEELSKIHWPILGIFGGQDRVISTQTVNQFKVALDSNGITNEIYIYKGVGHAFSNRSGMNYAPKETADAWQKTLAFLKKYL
jgi:carboxymethylenebutenolidase